MFANNKAFFVAAGDPYYLLALLNSPLLWWHNWRYLVHLKDEALTPSGYKMEQLPIAPPSDEQRQQVEERVRRILTIEDDRLQVLSIVKDWLAVEHGIAKPSQHLAELLSLTPDGFVEEVRRARGKKSPLTAVALRSLREEHARTIAPFGERLREAARLEAELSDLICQAYGLTAEEVELLWQTAPPRMPVVRPV